MTNAQKKKIAERALKRANKMLAEIEALNGECEAVDVRGLADLYLQYLRNDLVRKIQELSA